MDGTDFLFPGYCRARDANRSSERHYHRWYLGGEAAKPLCSRPMGQPNRKPDHFTPQPDPEQICSWCERIVRAIEHDAKHPPMPAAWCGWCGDIDGPHKHVEGHEHENPRT